MRYADSLPSTADLVIVGGGVVGAATAFYASRTGLRPLLLERRPRLCTLTTPVATGAFRLQFDNEEELRLVRQSVETFLYFPEVTGQREYDLGVRQQGYLYVTTTEAGMERQRRMVEMQHRWGQTDIEVLAGVEVRRRFPYVGSNALQARFRQGDGFLDQKQLTMGLAAASGAQVVTTCAVTGFRVEGGRLRAVETERGRVSADAAVIAAGPFSGVVAAQAGVELPISAVVRQKLIMPLAPEVPADAPMTIDDDTGSHWRPALQGAYLLFTDPSTPPSPPAEDVTPTHRFAFQLLDPASPVAVARVAPFWKRVWERSSTYWILQAGQYSVTPDHRPLIGRTPVEGLYVNTGYSGHGVMGSPGGSLLLADILTGRVSDGQNPFHPGRTFVQRELDIL
ncbi:MAG: FAD-binding oxidoreductase [Chloroflexi bacterium]|nr:FAD-binding oxidoreductase [Chloroflexota bacterium]